MHNSVGLGTFPLAGVFNQVSSKRAIEVISSFIDQGGFYIDTAPFYGFGEVEKILGRGLSKTSRDQYFLISKCGYDDVEGKNLKTVQKRSTYAEVIQQCNDSLARLQTDYIDLYMIHSPNHNTPFSETMDALIDLKKQGKIKAIGVSNVNLKELKEYNQTNQITYVQNRFNLITRSIDSELSTYFTNHQIKLIPYHVLEIGLLTGKVFENIEQISADDFRHNFSYWRKEPNQLIIDWVIEYLKPISEELGITIGQLAMSWVLHQPNIGFLIAGTTNPEYLFINLKSDQIKLSPTVLQQLDQAYQQLEDQVQKKHHQTLKQFRGLSEKYY